MFLHFHQIFPQFLFYIKKIHGRYFRNYIHPIRRNSRLASVASDKYSILKAKWSISLLKFLNCSTEIISRPFQNCPQDCLLAFQRQFDRNNYQITNPRKYVPTEKTEEKSADRPLSVTSMPNTFKCESACIIFII